MDPEVPLIVPEINPEQLANRPKGIIANANCTTLSMIVVVGALHRAFGLEELVVSSYQAASGAGQAGIDTLYAQMDKVAGTRSLGQRAGDVRSAVGDLGPFPAPLAMNVVPWAGSVKADGWSSEELKIRNESRKILGLPSLRVAATCVRVPVLTTHSVTVHAVFSRPVSRDEAWDVLSVAPGVVVTDDPEAGEFPTPVDVVGTDPSWGTGRSGARAALLLRDGPRCRLAGPRSAARVPCVWADVFAYTENFAGRPRGSARAACLKISVRKDLAGSPDPWRPRAV
jgi:aspartate-semialdehyde dehydrogenase